jgi:hypothetical protein
MIPNNLCQCVCVCVTAFKLKVSENVLMMLVLTNRNTMLIVISLRGWSKNYVTIFWQNIHLSQILKTPCKHAVHTAVLNNESAASAVCLKRNRRSTFGHSLSRFRANLPCLYTFIFTPWKTFIVHCLLKPHDTETSRIRPACWMIILLRHLTMLLKCWSVFPDFTICVNIIIGFVYSVTVC